ncbi:MAG TPA: 30S ribosomal protein S6 [Anaerolineales bacterium]|jgi:small subunit ribosomal protein S6|nr:30S ribosomal protein S6 [Anaerolineales bacterium]
MRKYEITYIAHPDLDADAFTQLNDQVKGWVKDSGGEIEKVDVWGKRKLAYPVKKQSEGQYVLLHTNMEPAACGQLERQFGLQESVLRFLIVAADETAEEPTG